MRFPQTDASYRPSFIIVLLLLASSAIASASCHTITPSGSGTKSGADWNNSCAGFSGSCAVASLVRGDTYYVGAGNYGGAQYNFNTPASGTSVITIQAATPAANCTNTGWNASTMQGRAYNFGPLEFSSDYWTWNGVYRASGNSWTSWNNPSGYGFAVNNTAGSGQAVNSSQAVLIIANDIKFSYTDIAGSYNGSSSNPQTVCDSGIWVEYPGGIGGSGNWTNVYIGYNHIHDTGAGPLIFDNTNYGTIEYNWLERDQYYDTCHSEAPAVRGHGVGLNYFTLRYNYIENTPGTAPGLATPETGASNSSNWYIYGNIIFANEAEEAGNAFRGGGGDGVMELLGDTGAQWNNIYFYNNTFANWNSLVSGTAISFGGGWPATLNSVFIQNNLWYNSGNGMFSCTVSTGTTNCGPPTVSNNTLDNTNRFVSVPNGGNPGAGGEDNFHLATDTAGWTPLANVTLPNGFVETLNQDMDGVTRTSSQGAFQFTNGSSTAPVPPSGLTVIIN